MSGLARQLISPCNVATRYGVCTKTLGRWRENGSGPLFVKAGRKILYPEDALLSWENARSGTSSSAVDRAMARAA